MLNFGPTFVFAIINLIVLYFILKRILFKPVTEFMEKRAKSIQDGFDNAERMKNEAMKVKMAYEEKIRQAHIDAEKILNDAHNKAEQDYEAVIEEAKIEADRLLEKSRKEIELERQQMIKEIRSQTASLALAAASKVLEEQVDTEKNRELVNKFLDEAGVA